MDVKTVKGCKIFSSDEPLRLTASDSPGDKFILLFGTKGKALFLTLGSDRLLYDGIGGVFACEDELLMVDTVDRPGVGIISLPENHWSNIAAKVHDFQTSCKVYQLNHSRSEAENDFENHLEAVSDTTGRKILSSILSGISQTFSWYFWDIDKTRWK